MIGLVIYCKLLARVSCPPSKTRHIEAQLPTSSCTGDNIIKITKYIYDCQNQIISFEFTMYIRQNYKMSWSKLQMLNCSDEGSASITTVDQ